jgi:hypothetical protein
MEYKKIEERNNIQYIVIAKRNIDNYIKKNDYRGAFTLFLLTMERLDSRDRQEFLDYFNLKLIN